MKFCIAFLACIAISFFSFSQTIPKNPNVTDAKGLRQGKWTLLFDANWASVTDYSKTVYYRLISYVDDKPEGIVRDYYPSGRVQWEGMLQADRPTEIVHGEATWYRADGTKEFRREFNNGTQVNEIIFNLDGTEAAERWKALNDTGLDAADQGDYIKAKDLLLKARIQAELEFGTKHKLYAQSVHNLGYIYWILSLHEKAETLYLESKTLFEELSYQATYQYASVLSNLAVLYHDMGIYEKAEPLSLESLALTKTAVGSSHPEYAASLNNLAGIYYEMGLYEKAEPLFIESNEILLKALGNEHPFYASSLNNLGSFYDHMGFYEKAISIYQQSKSIREKVLGKEHPAYAETLSNLAGLYRDLGLYEKAEALYLESKDIREKSVGKENPQYGLSLNNLGALYENMGQYEKAEQLQLESLKIGEKALGKEHSNYRGTLTNLALLYQNMHQYEKASTMFIESSHITLQQIERYFPSMSEKEKESFYGTVKTYIESFNSFALTTPLKRKAEILSDAYTVQLSTKALLFNANNKVRQRIVNSGNDSLINLFLTWQKQRSLLGNAYKMNADEQKAKKIDIPKLEEEINQQEKELSLQSEAFETIKDKTQYTWKDVQKQLKKGEAAIELIRFKKHGVYATVTDSSNASFPRYTLYGLSDTVYYAALIITSKSKSPEPVLLVNGDALENRLLKNYKNSIRFKITDSLSYNNFWKPIAVTLYKNKIRRVYLSPDGVYNSVNLNTLQNPVTGKYVVDELDLRLVPNTKDLITRKVEVTNSKTNNASLFGYPDYDSGDSIIIETDKNRSVSSTPLADSIQRNFEGGMITRLPGTQTEIKAIHALLASSQVRISEFMNRRATEDEIKSLNSPQVLHIATHGFFLEDVNTSDERTFAGFDTKKFVGNPLLRSGLLMAGSQPTINGKRNPDTEDGILTAYEAMNLSLDNTDLVVLSACETGLGEIRNGEGVYGLQRAFQTAGAKSILMSLWKVDDNATQELMTSFYKNWLKSGDKRDAFKKAQATVRAKYKHPYYWGAFVLVGE